MKFSNNVTQRFYVLLIMFLVCDCQIIAQGITPAQDSMLQFLVKNKQEVESGIQQYKSIQISWITILTTFGFGVALFILTWKLWFRDYLKAFIIKKAEEAISSLQNLKSTNILVLSAEGGIQNDKFLRRFFKEKQFLNVKFHAVADKKTEVPDDFDYGVVFANNEDGLLDESVVRQYLTDESVIFYFGKSGTWDWKKDSPELSKILNFANSRAQIYGNLMSSLEYLECVVPKYGKH